MDRAIVPSKDRGNQDQVGHALAGHFPIEHSRRFLADPPRINVHAGKGRPHGFANHGVVASAENRHILGHGDAVLTADIQQAYRVQIAGRRDAGGATGTLTLGSPGGTDYHDIAINQPLVSGVAGDGGLKKLGDGTLALSVAPTCDGDTNVVAGTLDVPSLNTPSSAVNVYGGGTLNAGSILADSLNIGGPAPAAAVNSVPEPGTLALLVLALGLAGTAWRRK